MTSFYQDHGYCSFCYYVGTEKPEDEVHCECAEESSKYDLHNAHVLEYCYNR